MSNQKSTPQVEYIPPAEYGSIKSPLEQFYKTARPAGLGSDPEITKRFEEANKATEDYAKALEDRFSQPNWFKIAGAFARPQLGGFLSSIGSAAEEMGAQREAAKAIEPTISRMRAEISTGQYTFAQRLKQKELFEDVKSGKVPLTEDVLNKLGEYGTDTDIYKTAQEYYRQRQERLGATGQELSLQEKVLKNPALILDDPAYTGKAARTADQSKEYLNKLNAARPPSVTQAEWNVMTTPNKEEAIATYANNKTKEQMTVGQKFAYEAAASHDLLDELSSIRRLAVDPNLAPLFAIGRNGDLFSQFRAFLEKNPGNTAAAMEGLYAAAMEQLKNATPETRAKADKLIKGISELEIRLRGTLNNPTDAASILSSTRSPNLVNSQSGFVGIIDQLGLNAYRDIEAGRLHSQLTREGVPSNDVVYSDQFRNFRENTRKLREQMANQYSLEQTPEWFGTRGVRSEQAPKEKPAESKPEEKKSASAQSNERVVTDPQTGKKVTYVREGSNWVRKKGE